MNTYEITFSFDHEIHGNTVGKFRVSEDALDSYMNRLRSDERIGRVSDIAVEQL